jgi:hydrogenase maturation protein HypF
MLACDKENENSVFPFTIVEQNSVNLIKVKELFSAIIKDLQNNVSQARIAARFHNTIARIILNVCQAIYKETGITQVVLSGGVFQNRLLLRRAVSLLEAEDFKVFTHCRVPCNDGGISLGQVVVANFSITEKIQKKQML